MVSLADIADNANLTRAVRFVGHDKDDEVIRDPLSDVPFLDDLGFRLPDISRRLIARTYEPRRVKVVEVGKSNYTTRPVSFIEMED